MIESETHARVTVIRIDRQEQRNALDTVHCEELRTAINTAVAGGARCLVLTGAGSAFCSGADLNQVYGEQFLAALYALLRRLT
ncbi:MAG: enoyl-CoA hydratase-related protein, partial [Micromonosporaceae bacterium]